MRMREIKKIKKMSLTAKLETSPVVTYSHYGAPSISVTLRNAKSAKKSKSWLKDEQIFNAIALNEKVIQRLQLCGEGDQIWIIGEVKRTQLLDCGCTDFVNEVHIEGIKFLESAKACTAS